MSAWLIIVVAGIFNVLASGTRIRIFSRLSPGGAGPADRSQRTSEADRGAVLEAPIAGAAESRDA